MQTKKVSKVIIFTILVLLTVLFLFPILFILLNSFKGANYISQDPFGFLTSESFVSIKN